MVKGDSRESLVKDQSSKSKVQIAECVGRYFMNE